MKIDFFKKILLPNLMTTVTQTEDGLVWFMMFDATFNNISVLSWRSVLLVEEIVLPGENHQPVASH
jgi:hypothetical protein